ncbi:MAG: class I SAM-dependent methyltransferase [Chloroflexota bacterium]|nr:class I SAM-dependent methyltransferase [Chloroflexota bacterium]
MQPPTSTIQADFDRIAPLTATRGWDNNSHYHGYLLKHVPRRCREALDIGSGTGDFARGLAQRSAHVLGLDLSPQMVRIATSMSKRYPNIEYRMSDVMQLDLPDEHYDCIASIATLHHMPMDAILRKMKAALRPGGTLLVLDLYEGQGWVDALANAVAVPYSAVLRLIKLRRLSEPPEVRQAWEEHGKSDKYLTLREVRRLCAEILPGSKVKRHLLWRYSIVWRKTNGGA